LRKTPQDLPSNKRIVKTLIVEDFPATAEAYGTIISTTNDFIFKVKIAHNCDEAIDALKRTTKDLVLLDIQIPASEDAKFISGEDIGLWLRKNHPKTKIIIITYISDAERIRSILKHIKPEGFFIKSDLDFISLSTAVQDILNGGGYFSKKIKQFTTNNNNEVNGHKIDDIDRKILYHLSRGEKNKDIANLVCISLRTVEERKARLKDVFGIAKYSSTNLIKEAKRRNFV
jgi:DNA-binding NarL/FixJ family response regulator